MNRGILIFAFNNSVIDYVAMAEWSARRIQRHLNLPVSVVTNSDIVNTVFDKVIVTDVVTANSKWFHDFDSSLPWYNANRVDAFELSPYQQTIVLDSDYVVASDKLLTLFDSRQEFMVHRSAVDVVNSPNYERNNYFGRHNMPMSWATVMYFTKSHTASAIFEMMFRIQHHWTHYRHLYGVADSTYRNDFSVSIAANLVYGYQARYPDIPWDLLNVEPIHKLSQLDQDCFRVDFELERKQRYITINNCDFHAMNKKHLGEIVANSR
jgi:hypothetical protein